MNKTVLSLMITLMIANTLTMITVAKPESAEGIQVIVVFKDRPDPALIRRHGVIKYAYKIIPGIACSLPQRAIDALVKNPKIAYIEKDIILQKPPWAGGGKRKEQPPETVEWGVDRIDADLVWDTNTGLGVSVAILDTGIDKDHPDLQNNINGGVNFVSKNWRRPPNPEKWDDDNGHGTWCAGIVAAIDNDIGVVGVAPEVHLYAVKVLDSTGRGYLSDVIAGIEWCVTGGIQVISMSLGSGSDSLTLHSVCDAAYGAGVVLVAAAGNSGDGDPETNDVRYPAKYLSVIAVAATAADDSTPTWSSEGEDVELAAPGVNVRSTWKRGTYETHDGTSAACPHVTGTVALVITSGISNPIEIRQILQETADDLGDSGHDVFYGYGLVDAEESATGFETYP